MDTLDLLRNALRLATLGALAIAGSGCATAPGTPVRAAAAPPAPAAPAAPSASSPLDADLAAILALLPGRYAGPATGGRLFHKIVPVVAPNFGAGAVFYHQISRDGFDSAAPFQQKIYVFDRDPARGFNRMRSWVFFPKQGFANLEQDAAALRTLQPAALMNFPIECAIRWDRGDAPGRYVARVRREDCTYDSAGFRQKISPELTYVLDRESFALEDILYGANGQPLFPSAGLMRAARQAR
jgi:hypothetical protein